MRFFTFPLIALLLGVPLWAAKVNIIETGVNDADGSTIGAVAVNQFVEIGTAYTTLAAPAASGPCRFTHWTYSGAPGTSYRDAWGWSQNPISFVLTVASTATAHYLPDTRDTDGDGLPDWYEMEYFRDLTHAAGNDSDGDGITLLAEYSGGTSPVHANNQQDGGVVWADSGSVTCNLTGYLYALRSVPAGTVNQSAAVVAGTVVTVPNLSGNAEFAYWTLDGVRQQDAWGQALSTFSFTMATANREAAAYLLTGDSDGDGVPDVYEQRYYGSLANNGASDTDGDGITLMEECTAGTSPLHANSQQEGGVSWVDSTLIAVVLQAEIAVEQPAGTGINDGTSNSLGNGGVGSTTSRTFTIRNVGGTPLTGLGITLSGTDAAMFSVIASPSAQVLHNSSTSFTVQFAPTSPGSKTATLQIASNDTDENPFDIVLTGNDVAASPFVAWMNTAGVPANMAGPMQAPHGDGVVNLLKFAFNLDPTKADSRRLLAGADNQTGMPVVSTAANGRLRLEFIRRKASGNPGIAYRAEFSSDLVSWVNLTGLAAVTPIDATWERLVVEDVPPAGARTRFARVSVSMNPDGTAPQTPFSQWMAALGVPADQAGAMQSPQWDSVPNLLKFAFNLDPTKPDARRLVVGANSPAGLPGMTCMAGKLRLEFIRRKAITNGGITCTPQFSSDLVSWTNFTGPPTTVTSIDQTWERVVVDDDHPTAAAARFGRLRVVEVP